MPARTGEQFLKGLKGPREVWVDGERVRDVVDHPKLGGAAHALAEVFDLHHRQVDALLMADPETGEKIAVKASIIAKKPDSVTHVDAAAIALIGLTAVVSVEDTLKLKKGETILIQGGAGGVANQCGVPPCTPTTCAQLPAGTCGQVGDGCGGLLNCPACPAGEACGGGGA